MKKEVKINEETLNFIIKELKAGSILGGPEDEYKQVFNEAMRKAIRIVELYKKGEGIFQY